MKNDPGFAKAFADARKTMGAGKQFTYKGKSYSTNRADDKPSAPVASSMRPKSRPAAMPAMTETERRAGRQAAPSPNLATPAGRAAAGASLRADKTAAQTAAARRPAPVYDNSKNVNVLSKMKDFIAGGGMSGADKRRREKEKAMKAAETAGASRTVRGFSKGGYVSKGKGGKC